VNDLHVGGLGELAGALLVLLDDDDVTPLCGESPGEDRADVAPPITRMLTAGEYREGAVTA
jgi:hypothetical protein